jgi:hypothetical protein
MFLGVIADVSFSAKHFDRVLMPFNFASKIVECPIVLVLHNRAPALQDVNCKQGTRFQEAAIKKEPAMWRANWGGDEIFQPVSGQEVPALRIGGEIVKSLFPAKADFANVRSMRASGHSRPRPGTKARH